jgi:hypothetical protein
VSRTQQLLVAAVATGGAGVAAAPADASEGGFGFEVPPGWLDLSPGAPAANFSKVTPEVAAQARNKDFIFFAADVEHAQADGILANVNGTLVSEKPSKVTKESLEGLASGLGADFAVREKTLLDVGGVAVGRIVDQLAVKGGKPDAQVLYILPGKDGDAALTFTTSQEHFARDQPAFEAAMRATTGLVEPASDEAPNWVMDVAIGASVALGLLINAFLQKRRNRNLWGTLEPVLRKGPATLAELTAAIGKTGFMSRGKVALALQEATGDGRVEVIPAPEGTPQLQKVKLIKYSLRA